MTDVDEEFTSYLAVAFPRLRRTAFPTGTAIKTIRLHGLAVSVAAAP